MEIALHPAQANRTEHMIIIRSPLCVSYLLSSAEVVIAPPSIFLIPVKVHLKNDNDQQVAVAAQNGYHEKFGAFTGEIS